MHHRGGDSRRSFDVCKLSDGDWGETLLTGNSRHFHVLRNRNAAAKGGARHPGHLVRYNYNRSTNLYMEQIISRIIFNESK